MRQRWWVIFAGVAAISCSALTAAWAGGLGSLMHRDRKNQEQAEVCIKKHAWMAYLHSDDGGLSPVRSTQNMDHDEDWLGLRFTEYEGPRIRMGVLKVINKSARSEEGGGGGQIEVPVAGIQEILTEALYNTRRFDVIDQKRFGEIEAQQTRKDVLEPSPTSIMNAGKVLQAQYLVYGTVNEWTPQRSNRKMAFGLPISGAKQESEVAITFSLADVANGQILFTTTERARLSNWSFSFQAPAVPLPGLAAGRPTNGNGGDTTPISYAIRSCANKAALRIAMFLRDRKWRGSVVDIKQADVYINAGSEQGMAPQTKLLVQSFRGLVRDPENRSILGEDLRSIGTLEVVNVQTGFSIAQVVDGCNGLKRGDRVELSTPPQLPETIPACDALDTTKQPY